MSEFLSTVIANVQQRPMLLLPFAIVLLYAMTSRWFLRRTAAPWNQYNKYNTPVFLCGATYLVLLQAAPQSTPRDTVVGIALALGALFLVLDWRNTRRVLEAAKHAPPPPADQIASPAFRFRVALGTSLLLAGGGAWVLVAFGTFAPTLITAVIALAGSVAFGQIAFRLRGVRGIR